MPVNPYRNPIKQPKPEVLAKHCTRLFLQDGDRLSSVSFIHNVSRHTHIYQDMDKSIYVIDKTELKIFLKDKVIKLHSCDLSSVEYGLGDFVRKLNVITGTLDKALEFIKSKPAYGDKFVIKEFLNGMEGAVDIYTSTIAITISPTHGTTFEIASCDYKTRITLSRKAAPRFFDKLNKFIKKAVVEVQRTLDNNQGKLTGNK